MAIQNSTRWITIEEVVHPPFWMFQIYDSTLRPFINDRVNYSLRRRQELDPVYRQNGAVYVTRKQLLVESGILFSAYDGGDTGCGSRHQPCRTCSDENRDPGEFGEHRSYAAEVRYGIW